MKFLFVSVLGLIISVSVFAQQKMNMNYLNEEITTIIAAYAKASNQKFVIDPSVRGKVTILLPELVSTEEAFNHLSSALAINGYAISKQGDTMVVKSARNVQRDLVEVSTQRPSLKPERMYTWIYKAKYLPADSIVRELRIINSKDGEVTSNVRTNQLIICDWASNINRIADLMAEIDKPIDVATAKLVEESRKEREKIRPMMPPPMPQMVPNVPMPGSKTESLKAESSN